MPILRIALPLAVVLLAAGGLLLLSGCGDRDSTSLSPQAELTVASFERDVRASTSLDDRTSGPSYGELLASLNAVIAVARSNPDALYTRAGQTRARTMSEVLLDAAITLAPYEPGLTRRLILVAEARS